MSEKVSLDIIEFTLREQPKKDREVYFIFILENPENRDEQLISVVPENNHTLSVEKDTLRRYIFKPKGIGAMGKRIFTVVIPEDGFMQLDCHVMHSRKKARNTGEIFQEIVSAIGTPAKINGVLNIMGQSIPWITVAKAALYGVNIVGKILENANDKLLQTVHIQIDLSSLPEGKQKAIGKNSPVGAEVLLKWEWHTD